MNRPLPQTIPDYLEQLRDALRDADPAVLQDALYDAEEYLRSALAEHPDRAEAEVLAEIASSYGDPEEVAEIYRGQEAAVTRALRMPPIAPPRHSTLGRFFSVAADPHTYGALFYLLLSLPVGIVYFTWAAVGLSLSVGLAVLIIGLPFVLVFMATVYALSLIEGRLVEAMLGERMPRRPPHPGPTRGLWQRIKAILGDGRTWASLLYMLLMLPLGIVYFTFVVTALSVSLSLTLAPLAWLPGVGEHVHWGFPLNMLPPMVAAPTAFAVGVIALFATLHAARGIGRLHAQIAKRLLVRIG
jgi:hypothetical protein